MKSKKRNSPRRRIIDQREESTDQEYSQSFDNEHFSRASGMMIDDVTGNITHMSDSVILDIEKSSSASSSVSEMHIVGVDEEDENDSDELHCDDWEIRMLAAELNRRESKRGEQLFSSGTTSEADGDESRLVHRRSARKRSDAIEPELNEAESRDQSARPRAASLDQHNLRREKTKGVFKAFSFDRDKDRL